MDDIQIEPGGILADQLGPVLMKIKRVDMTGIIHRFGHGHRFCAGRRAHIENGFSGFWLDHPDDIIGAQILRRNDPLFIQRIVFERFAAVAVHRFLDLDETVGTGQFLHDIAAYRHRGFIQARFRKFECFLCTVLRGPHFDDPFRQRIGQRDLLFLVFK